MSLFQDAAWWGRFPVTIGRTLRLRLGPLELWAERHASEWVLSYRHGTDPLEDACSLDEADPREVPEDVHVTRHALRATQDHLQLEAALARRPMVVAVETQLFLPSEQHTVLHLSTALSVRVMDGSGIELLTVPSVPPQETWFGRSSIDGVVADASRTKGRLLLDDLTLRSHRAVTSVALRNRAADAMAIESLQVPLPQLGLYVSPSDGQLWTSGLTIERDAGGIMGRVLVDRDAPRPGATLLEPPQVAPQSGVLHAMSALFS